MCKYRLNSELPPQQRTHEGWHAHRHAAAGEDGRIPRHARRPCSAATSPMLCREVRLRQVTAQSSNQARRRGSHGGGGVEPSGRPPTNSKPHTGTGAGLSMSGLSVCHSNYTCMYIHTYTYRSMYSFIAVELRVYIYI